MDESKIFVNARSDGGQLLKHIVNADKVSFQLRYINSSEKMVNGLII